MAGTDHDTNNLSILMTARDLNPELFVVARQNRDANTPLFRALEADIIAEGSQTLAHRIRILLNTPLLKEFIGYSRSESDEWARWLNRELTEEIGEAPPEVWEVELSEKGAPVILEALRRGDEITLDILTTNPFNRKTYLGCRPLLLAREDERIALPSREESLKVGDRVLFCGMPGNEDAMGSLLHDRAALDYLIGEPSPRAQGAGRKPAH